VGAPAPVAAAPNQAAPVTGSIAGMPAGATGPTGAKKKSKSGVGTKDRKANEAELHRLRQEVAKKLKFQNSFDTAPKMPKIASKPKPKEKDPKAKTAAQPTQVKVAQFRDAKSAKAKVAELQKQGIKASLKSSKDKQGTYYTVYRQSAPKAQGSESLAKKPAKAPESKPKPNSP